MFKSADLSQSNLLKPRFVGATCRNRAVTRAVDHVLAEEHVHAVDQLNSGAL